MIRLPFVLSRLCLIGATLGWFIGFPAFGDTIKLSFNSDWSPYSSGESEQVDGQLVRLAESVLAGAMKLNIEVTGLPWSRVQRAVETGRVDAMITYPSKERLTYTLASKEPVFHVETRAFVRRGSKAERALKADPSIDTLKTLKHCIILGDEWSKSFMEKNDLTYSVGRETKSCIRQIAAGRQSVFLHVPEAISKALSDLELEDEIIALPKAYKSVPLHLLVSKHSKLGPDFIAAFDDKVAELKSSGHFTDLTRRMLYPIEAVRISTLEWPPYTGRNLPGNGAVTEIVRQAFGQVGTKAEPVFLPWKRAIAQADTVGNDIAAYYPGYHCRHSPGFIPSNRIGEGPLYLAEHADNDISWEDLGDLEGIRIGTVVGYANTTEFDEMVDAGTLTVFSALNDHENLIKLANGLLDAVVIDKFVFRHLMETEADLRSRSESLRLDSHPIRENDLFLCFNDTERGRILRSRFNRGLSMVDIAPIWTAQFQKYGE